MPWVAGPRGRWEGGRVWQEADGGIIYVIRRMVNGRRFHVSTRASTITAARAQLERFEADPEGYDPAAPSGEAVRFSEALVKAFLDWSRTEKRNSRPWVNQQKMYLGWWADKLGTRDLRKVSLPAHIVPALDGVPGRKHRITALKTFYAWLRRERHMVSRVEDPTLDLQVKAPRPEQWIRPKVIKRGAFLKVLQALDGDQRDALRLLNETGWHVSELVRFVRDGAIEAMPPGRTDAVAVAIVPQRKSGEMMRTGLGPGALESAKRLREKGTFSVSRFYDAIKSACRRLKLKGDAFSPGRFRHTAATRMVEAGADPAAVASYLGHRSAATTRRFYATLAVVPRPRGSGD